MWFVRAIIKGTNGYLCALVPEHPKCNKHGYVLHHRIVMENNLGRMLEDWEIVHHKNGITDSNGIENLEVMTKGEHSKLHNTTGKFCVELKCPNCGIIFVRKVCVTHIGDRRGAREYTTCSHTCSATLRGKDIDPKKIAENIQRYFYI